MAWTATEDPLNRRWCDHCGALSDGSDCFGGPDPCLGYLPGVFWACCGHGDEERHPYVWFIDGTSLEGTDALEYFASVST